MVQDLTAAINAKKGGRGLPFEKNVINIYTNA
jgi:hypothetical protein